jgi:hypothetical protein
VITTDASGPGCIIQSDFKSGTHGNFEVVVLEGRNLVHYFHDNSDVNAPWRRAQTISTAATSGAGIIQSDFKSGQHGNFEVVVREGSSLVHYFHDNSNVRLPWQRGQTISTVTGGPATLIQSDFKAGSHGNFELLTVEGNSVAHYFHDNSNVNAAWRRGQTVTSPASGAVGLVQSDFNSRGHGDFEAVTFHDSHVFHVWRDNSSVTTPWHAGQIVSPSGRSQKVCQLTGDTNFQNRAPTKNLTETGFQGAGTDLGYPFEHDGRLYFLFGDTHHPPRLRRR